MFMRIKRQNIRILYAGSSHTLRVVFIRFYIVARIQLTAARVWRTKYLAAKLSDACE